MNLDHERRITGEQVRLVLMEVFWEQEISQRHHWAQRKRTVTVGHLPGYWEGYLPLLPPNE